MNSIISIKETAFAIRNFPMKKTPASKFFNTFKEGVAPMPHELFQRIESEGAFPNSFYVIRITS